MIQIYHGDGKGKTTAAVGQCIRAASRGYRVIIIQFLKGRNETEKNFFTRLEPEIKYFNFAKAEVAYNELDEAGRSEEVMNLKNGFNYSKKVVSTGACDLIVLDEILGLVDEHVITIEEIKELLEAKPEEMTIICTGRVLDDRLRPYVDEIYNISPEKQ